MLAVLCPRPLAVEHHGFRKGEVAESRLIGTAQMPPGKRGPGSTRSRGGAPKGAPASVIGRLISGPIAGDRPDREAGHGCGVPRPAPVGALPPSFGAHGKTAYPAPQRIGVAERWLALMKESKNRCALFSPYPAGGGSTPRRGGGVGFAPQAPSARREDPTRARSACPPSPCRGGLKKKRGVGYSLARSTSSLRWPQMP